MMPFGPEEHEQDEKQRHHHPFEHLEGAEELQDAP